MTPVDADLDAWSAWSPGEVTQRLQGIDVPWYVAGGWAIDLFLGGPRRAHDDLEIGVPQARFRELLPAWPDCDAFVIHDERAYALADAGPLVDDSHQTWLRERATGRWRLDLLREPASADGQWIARRDPRIRLPYAALIERDASGVPYGCPEAILLFKAKAARPKDEGDFAAVLPHLDARRRAWLRDALRLAHPGHPWIDRLA